MYSYVIGIACFGVALGQFGLPGQPGADFPIYAKPPTTTFSCAALDPGFYADPEAECQTYHRCGDSDEPILTLLCPNGTLYNQQYFVCDWWFNVDCSQAEDFYSLNADVKAAGEAATEAARNGRDFPDVEGLASERGGRRAQQG